MTPKTQSNVELEMPEDISAWQKEQEAIGDNEVLVTRAVFRAKTDGARFQGFTSSESEEIMKFMDRLGKQNRLLIDAASREAEVAIENGKLKAEAGRVQDLQMSLIEANEEMAALKRLLAYYLER